MACELDDSIPTVSESYLQINGRTHLFACRRPDHQSCRRRGCVSQSRAERTTRKASTSMKGTEYCSGSCIVEGSGKNHRFQESRTCWNFGCAKLRGCHHVMVRSI